jgi:hypothetical protein
MGSVFLQLSVTLASLDKDTSLLRYLYIINPYCFIVHASGGFQKKEEVPEKNVFAAIFNFKR